MKYFLIGVLLLLPGTAKPEGALFRKADRELQAARLRISSLEPEADAAFADSSDTEWIKRRLAAMSAADQYVRGLVGDYLSGRHDLGGSQEAYYRGELNKMMDEVDQRHTENLKTFLKERDGKWFSLGEFGTEATTNAWLIVQHADRDPEFQKNVLEAIKALAPYDVDAKNLAYLEDRVAVKLGRPQFYGTQMECVGSKPQLQNQEGTDLAAVDRNRLKVGLTPLAEYLRRFDDYCRHSVAR